MEYTKYLIDQLLGLIQKEPKRYEIRVKHDAILLVDHVKVSRYTNIKPSYYIYNFDPLYEYEKDNNAIFLEQLRGFDNGPV